MLQLRQREVRDEFDLSASANLMAPSLPILLPVLSENQMKQQAVLLRSSSVRVEFDRSASDNLKAPSLPIILPILSENEMKQQVCYS
jgi:hypothetical protein